MTQINNEDNKIENNNENNEDVKTHRYYQTPNRTYKKTF
jgi:hypothetical protein